VAGAGRFGGEAFTQGGVGATLGRVAPALAGETRLRRQPMA